jgi:hypothetical protein
MSRNPTPKRWGFCVNAQNICSTKKKKPDFDICRGYCHVDSRLKGDAVTIAGMKGPTLPRRTSATHIIFYAGYRFPPDVISYAL